MMETSKPESKNKMFLAGCLAYGFGCVFILAGLVFMAITAWYALRLEVSRSWPEVDAQVVSSTLGFRVDSDNDRFVDPKVKYRYLFAGVSYTGDRVSFGTGDAVWSQSRVNAYPVNSLIKVRVNPENPVDSVIEPGGQGWERFLPLGSLVPFGAGISIMLTARRRMKSVDLNQGSFGPKKIGPKGHWIPATVGIVMATVGAFIVQHGWNENRIARDSSTWPTVEGTIVLSESHREWDSGDKRHHFVPVVVYTYEVNGVTFASDRVQAGGIKRSYRKSAAALSQAKRYPEGTPTLVAYNPSKPEEATLMTGENVKSWMSVVFGGVFTLIAVGVALLFFPRPRFYQASNQGIDSPRS
ncbi:MAG: hypothetical protein CMJ28_07960 [Phycisphaerae bacterium]|nr:hypothetical protein [Phycisphaerae bacterium]